MAGKTKSMHQIANMFRLLRDGYSIRQVSRSTGMSKNTVKRYRNKIAEKGYTYEEVSSWDEEELSRRLEIGITQLREEAQKQRREYFEGQIDYFREEMKKTGMSYQQLWREYRQKAPQGYGKSQFSHYIRQAMAVGSEAVYHHTHIAGEEMMIDFAGDRLSYIEKETGEVIKCEVLVCVLPYSGYTYVEVLRSQQQEQVIEGIVNALNYIGGTPKGLKSDNLKSVIRKAHRYDPEVTEAMSMLGAHYKMGVGAARPYKPRDKAKVENAVRVVYQRIYAVMRNEVHHSPESLQVRVLELVNNLNDQLLTGKGYSRRELFEKEEKEKLSTLPNSAYEYQQVSEAKVQRSYHIVLGKERHYYSVPYQLVGQKVKVIFTHKTVEVYNQNMGRVAIHMRNFKPHGYTTHKDHMPAHHASMLSWDSENFISKANQIGTYTGQRIKRILDSTTYQQQSYNTCQGILQLAKKYGSCRVEKICEMLHELPHVRYHYIKGMLDRNRDKQDEALIAPGPVIHHTNIRGANYYQ